MVPVSKNNMAPRSPWKLMFSSGANLLIDKSTNLMSMAPDNRKKCY